MTGRSRGRSKNKNEARGTGIGLPGWRRSFGLSFLGLSILGFAGSAGAQVTAPSTYTPPAAGGGISTGIGGSIAGGVGVGAPSGGFAAFGPPPAPATAPPPLPVGPLDIPTVPPAWLLVPSIEVGEAFNDNVNLAPRGSRVWDFITTVSPGLTLTGQTARLNVALTYNPQELIFARSSPSNVLQQRLLGTGRAELWREVLFVEGSASISQAFVRSTGPIAQTTLTTSNNLQTVSSETISPYVLQHLGSYANSESRYRFSKTETSGAIIAPEQIHELRQTFLGGEFFGRLGWSLIGDMTQLERGQLAGDPFSGITSKDTLIRADFKYPVYQALAVIGGTGYERISDPTLSVQPKGVIWNAGLQYQPNELVFASLTYGQRFEQSDIEFNASYNLDPQLRLSASYTQTIQTSQSQLAGNTAGLAFDPTTGQFVTQGTPGGIPITGGRVSASGISSGSFLAKTASLNATLTKERNTYSAQLYTSKVSGNATTLGTTTLTAGTSSATFGTNAATVTAERIMGANTSWTHQLQPNLSSTAGAGYYRTLFQDGTGRRDNTYTVSIGLTYTLSRTASANLTLSRSDLRSNIAVNSLVDDIVMATIRKEF